MPPNLDSPPVDDVSNSLFHSLLCITLDSSSDSDDPKKACQPPRTRDDRTLQHEDDFQALRRTYRPRVDDGELCNHLSGTLLCGPHSNTIPPLSLSKSQAQDLLHAVEELYFFRRYAEALRFTCRFFNCSAPEDATTKATDARADDIPSAGNSSPHPKLLVDADTRDLLRHYRVKCLDKMESPYKGERQRCTNGLGSAAGKGPSPGQLPHAVGPESLDPRTEPV